MNLKGEGFQALVQEGDSVQQGTPLLQVDLEYVKKHAPSIVTPVVFTNLPADKEVKLLKQATKSKVQKTLLHFNKRGWNKPVLVKEDPNDEAFGSFIVMVNVDLIYLVASGC